MKLLLTETTDILSLRQDGWRHYKIANTGFKGLWNVIVVFVSKYATV